MYVINLKMLDYKLWIDVVFLKKMFVNVRRNYYKLVVGFEIILVM